MKNIAFLFSFLLFYCCNAFSLPYRTIYANEEWKYSQEVKHLKLHVLETVSHLEGWCSIEKALYLMNLVLETKPRVCVEIGVFGGASVYPVASMLKYLKEGKVFAIDAWNNEECTKNQSANSPDTKWWSHVNMLHIYNGFRKLIKETSLQKYCVVIKTPACRAASRFSAIDLLHIDGNTSEISSLQDVEIYLPKVKKGGYIFFNAAKWQSRQPALDYLLKSCELIDILDHGECWVLRKNSNS